MADFLTGLVGHWALDEGTGTTAADSVGGSNGTLTNGPTWSTDGAGNPVVVFDGVNDYINVGDVTNAEINGDFSYFAMVNANALPGASQRMWIASKGGDGVTSSYEWELSAYGYSSPPKYRVYIYQSSSSAFIQAGSSTTCTTAADMLVGFTYEASTHTLTIYVNGAPDGSSNATTGTIHTARNATFQIGRRADASEKTWNGTMREHWSYSRALAADDVAALYAALTGAGGTTVSLTGQSAIASAGALASSSVVALAGQSASVARGALTPSALAALAGQPATTSRGALAPSVAVGVSGQAAAAAKGAVSAGSDVTAALTGLAATTARGTVAPSAVVAVAGQAATVAKGSITAGSDVTAALTGLAATAAKGALTPSVSLSVVGQSAATAGGTVTASAGSSVTVGLTGLSTTASAGALISARTVATAGQRAATTQGQLVPGLSFSLAGQSVSTGFGALALGIVVVPLGRRITVTGGLVSGPPPTNLTTDPHFVASAAGRKFTAPARGRNFTVH